MTRRNSYLIAAALFVAGLALGALMFGRSGGPAAPAGGDSAPATVWTCSMHPQIRLPEFGQCPICFMDLIPASDEADSAGPTQLAMSEDALRLAEVETAPVERRFVEGEVRTSGKIAVDERRLRTITAWTGGRLDRMFVDYVGVPVRAGDHLAEIYSPELYSAQAELVQAKKAAAEIGGASPAMRATAEATVDAARSKLRLLGLQEDQIREIERRGEPSERITIYAPAGGIVVERHAREGEYVDTGSPIVSIAELDPVWVLLDVYESDLVWIHYGERVEFEVEAYPGETFEGRIAFIDPVVSPSTRTVRVRVNAANPRQRLKPDMFVRAVIRTKYAGDGRTVAPDLAGKWISPMHPEIVKDKPGTCDVCGMPLVRASELGFVTDDRAAEPPLIIPVTAPLLTGKRAIVYVKVPGAERPTFEAREVVLGPRAGGYYLVLSGLVEGEQVVAKGAFKIDSAMQIQAKPSMMSRPGETAAVPGVDAVRERAASLYDAYFALHAALSGDDLAAAKSALAGLDERLKTENANGLAPAARAIWDPWLISARKAVADALAAVDLAAVRTAFVPVSDAFLSLDRAIGPPSGESHRLVFCPMAFDNRGAHWLQRDDNVRNPYYGASMLRCGAVQETFAADGN